MRIFKGIECKANQGPADWFSGDARVQPVLGPEESASLRSAVVSFAAGARTAWHTHPRGQMIFVISGVCRTQKEGGEIQVLTAGDAAWFAPNEKHWHGAAEDRPMVHLAVQEADEKAEVVTWMEKVDR